MVNVVGGGDVPHYDRGYLLGPGKRNKILELWEFEKFGRDSFGDPNAVSLYGMTPPQWHAHGVRILGRAAVEAARDPLADRNGNAIAQMVSGSPAAVCEAADSPNRG